MADRKVYYWLKLKEDFFEEDTIEWLEEQENGKEYCLFYLKLCLKSLKTDGVLVRNVGDILIPYDVKKLAEMTNTKLDTVKVAMNLFSKIGLIKILENGEIYMSKLSNMVGSETKWANYKKKERAKKKLDNVQKMSIESPQNVHTVSKKCLRETEKEKEIEIETETDNRDITKLVNVVVEMLDEKINYSEAKLILEDSNNDIEIIKNVYDYSKTQDINNLVGFMRKLVKPGAFKNCIQQGKQNSFNNFEPRHYDYDKLESKLLGWE